MEWTPSASDTISWSVKMSTTDGLDLLTKFKDYLKQENILIGFGTFTSGFMLVLHEACRSGHIQFVKYFLHNYHKYFDINQLILYHPNFDYDISLKSIRWLCNHRKETLIHAAVHSQHVELLQLLVSQKASVDTPDCCSLSPLMKAVSKCDKDVITYLLNAGCNVNYQDSAGCTALMHICRTHVLPDTIGNILRILMEAGADPTITDQRGFTVVHEAVYNKNSVVLKLLIKTYKISPFFNGFTQPLYLASQLLDLYSSKPMCLFPTQTITDHQNCSPLLKIHQILLNATYSLYRYCCDYNHHPDQDLRDCVTQFEHAVRLSVKLQVKFENSSSLSDVYGSITSINSLEDFLKKYTNTDKTTSNLIEMAYLCLLIREHILGYGDSTLIEFLFLFGKAFSETGLKDHIKQGLKLWLRATEMLLHRLNENIYSNLKELQKLTESGLEKCSDLIKYNIIPQNKAAVATHYSLLWPILDNLIQCEYISNQQFKSKHYHDIISPAGYRYLVRVLQDLHFADVQVSSLINNAVLKCSTFGYGFELSTNLIDVLLDEPKVSLSFLSLLLKNGAHKVINNIGLFGIRPLYKAKTREVADLLLLNGAHVDAVNEDGLYGNPLFIDKLYRSPLPLKCLVSRAIVFYGIAYTSTSCSLSDELKNFISMHNPDYTQMKIKRGLTTLK